MLNSQIFKTDSSIGISIFNVFEIHVTITDKNAFKIGSINNLNCRYIRIGKLVFSLWIN